MARSLGHRLAAATKDRGPLANNRVLQWRRTMQAWLTGPAVHLVRLHETACCAVGIDVTANRGAACTDRGPQHIVNRSRQRLELPARNIARQHRGMNARLEQRFIRVDVPYSCDCGLIEQCCLDRASRISNAFAQRRRSDRQRIGTQTIQPLAPQRLHRVKRPQPAEAARIAEHQPSSGSIARINPPQTVHVI